MQIGVVSDEELLDLLELALSSDTTNTVRRARDLMRSRVDPMQLVSQLANLIMDILSGRTQSDISEAGRNLLGRRAGKCHYHYFYSFLPSSHYTDLLSADELPLIPNALIVLTHMI